MTTVLDEGIMAVVVVVLVVVLMVVVAAVVVACNSGDVLRKLNASMSLLVSGLSTIVFFSRSRSTEPMVVVVDGNDDCVVEMKGGGVLIRLSKGDSNRGL